MNRINTHASLFSGFGAADLAATWMGWNNAFWCEIDEFPRRVLSYWFPKSVGYANIKETDFSIWKGKIDVLTGGFPCQPFSCAGKRKGAEDDRYLWPEMLRAIREIQPTWVVGENVAGIISMVQPGSEITVESQASLFEKADKETLLEQEYVVETVCRDLEREGYSVQPVIIPACSVGAPHRRDRVWFIAHRADSRAESVQHGGKNSTDQPATASYANGFGGETGRTNREWKENRPENRKRIQRQALGLGKKLFAPDSRCERCNNRCYYWEKRPICYNEKRDTTENQSKRAKWEYRPCKDGPIATDTASEGLQWAMPQNTKLSTEPFRNFPTQSPVCRRDDGLPFDVECLAVSFSKWRAGAIKGYGNAIVPQVIYEIFKSIETIQDKK